MRRVLVIRFSSLGDILLTFPSLSYLASQDCEIHYLTKESFRPLVEMAVPAVSANGPAPRLIVHTISNHASLGELLAKVRALKMLQFDIVLDLHRNLRSRIASLIIGSRFARVWKFRIKELFLFVFRAGAFRALGLGPISRPGESVRVAALGLGSARLADEAWARVARSSLLESLDAREGVVGQISGKFANGYVCVAAESAWAQKQWPVERFIAVAKRAAARGVGVVWIGLRDVPKEAHFEGAADLTRQLSLYEVALVLKRARTLVCNDSGLMHLSEAVGTPVVAIFGPTTRELGFAPRLSNSRIVEAELWCRPCSKTGRLCIRPFARRKCLTDVSEDSVWSAVENVLGHDAEGQLS